MSGDGGLDSRDASTPRRGDGKCSEVTERIGVAGGVEWQKGAMDWKLWKKWEAHFLAKGLEEDLVLAAGFMGAAGSLNV